MTTNSAMRNTVFRRLPVDEAVGLRTGSRHRLRQVYRRRDLVVLCLGVVIGAGIFSIAGEQAATTAGPSVIVSFVVAGGVCLLAALSYAELSSTIPVAGSAYSFTYVIYGELWAWIIGWALILEMAMAAAVVARAWSLYAVQTLNDFGVSLPDVLAHYTGRTSGFDLFALLILALITVIVAYGARLGLRILWIMVIAKVAVIGLVIIVGLAHIDFGNYTPFVPPAQPMETGEGGRTLLQVLTGGQADVFGLFGIFTAAAAVAFAYLGFDIIATAAEETEDSRVNTPRGMLNGLLLTIALYMGVAIIMIGIVSYTDLNPAAPLPSAFEAVGAGSMSRIIGIGALLGLTTVILVVIVGVTRVMFSMARDGLMPGPFAVISPRYRTPSQATMITGTIAIVVSQVVNVLTLAQLTVIATLFVFVFVSAGVLVLRRSHPKLPRGFRVPGVPVIPVLTIIATCWLMLNLAVRTWLYFGVWMVGGLLLYAIYGSHRSRLGRHLQEQIETRGPGGRHAAHRRKVRI